MVDVCVVMKSMVLRHHLIYALLADDAFEGDIRIGERTPLSFLCASGISARQLGFSIEASVTKLLNVDFDCKE